LENTKKFLSETAIYGLGIAISKGIGFLIVPVITRIFSPADYGIIDMLVTVGGISAVFMTLGLDSALSFFYMEAKNKELNTSRVIASTLHIRILVGIVVILIVVSLANIINTYLFDNLISTEYIYLITLTVFFGTMVSQSLEIFRLVFKPWKYVLLSLTQSVGGALLILMFVAYYQYGINGYLYGLITANSFAMIIGFVSTNSYRKWHKIEPYLWKKYIRFGLPLVPAGLLMLVMKWSDRWFIIKMMSTTDLGIFALGAKVSLVVTVMVEAFRKAWWPHAMDLIHKKEGPEVISKLSLNYVLYASIFSVALTIIAPLIVDILAPPEYEQAKLIVGIYAWSSIFYGFFMVSLIGVFASKKTYLNIYAFAIGAALNVFLNYILIPTMGIVGAGIATSMAILISNIAAMIISSYYYPIKWRWKEMILLLVVSWGLIYLVIEQY